MLAVGIRTDFAQQLGLSHLGLTEAFTTEQEALPRTLLPSFLHNCQHSIRTDCHVHLLCGLEPS